MRAFLQSFALLLTLLLTLWAPSAQAEMPPVYLLTIDGPIGPAYSDYLAAGIEKAGKDGAQAVVVALNTPGGLLASTRDMVSTILAAPLPVIVWVTPSGAHAASAGTFLLQASHLAVMDESTNIGAATPVDLARPLGGPPAGEEEPKEKGSASDANKKALENKAIEDTAAFIRGLAALRGRNTAWAEKAVTEAAALTEREALAENVIDLVATNETMLLQKINGRTIAIKNAGPVTLHTSQAEIIRLAPDFKTRIMAFITDPNVAFILMSIGVYGLILEFYNPGSLIPGTIGAVSLVLGLYALNLLPLNATGIILLLIGIAFMIGEAFVPSFGILGLMGIAAFIFGAMLMFDTDLMPGMALDPGLVWGVAVFGVLMIALIVWVTVKTYRKQISTGTESMIGQKAVVIEWQDTKGMVRVQGELWHARSEQALDLTEEDEVRIEAVDNLTLQITPLI